MQNLRETGEWNEASAGYEMDPATGLMSERRIGPLWDRKRDNKPLGRIPGWPTT